MEASVITFGNLHLTITRHGITIETNGGPANLTREETQGLFEELCIAINNAGWADVREESPLGGKALEEPWSEEICRRFLSEVRSGEVDQGR
tara:strand:+ start:1368 stop:1643 length:276 start_codon:yes stop_codon:yes gene_type:complete